MDSLLDAVISNTEARMSGAVVVSENHDVGSINWVAGMSDPGEMIGCGQYQELRRVGNESDADYQKRLERLLLTLPPADAAKIRAFGVKAATRRAGLDTSTGKVAVMVAGQPAWHGLGVNVAHAVNAEQAIELATMAWSASKRELAYQKADGTWVGSKDTFAVVRDDTEAKLGTVGTRYKIIQNKEGFAFLDQVLGEYGGKFHTAGAVFGGEKVWMQCELPAHAFEVVSGDRVEAFATFTNTHDGSGKAWCFPITDRIVCRNTLNVASRERRKGLGIRHTGDVKASVAQARVALGLAVQGFGEFKEAAETMVRVDLEPQGYFANLLDAVMDITQAEVQQGHLGPVEVWLRKQEAERALEKAEFDRLKKQRENVLEDILQRYESERCGVGGIRGTAWAAFNAVTEHADHAAPRRQVGSEEARASRRFESTLDGDADELKQTALEMVMARVAS
jgi:phage/plasmid-like protein (TIGR03299 family)